MIADAVMFEPEMSLTLCEFRGKGRRGLKRHCDRRFKAIGYEPLGYVVHADHENGVLTVSTGRMPEGWTE